MQILKAAIDFARQNPVASVLALSVAGLSAAVAYRAMQTLPTPEEIAQQGERQTTSIEGRCLARGFEVVGTQRDGKPNDYNSHVGHFASACRAVKMASIHMPLKQQCEGANSLRIILNDWKSEESYYARTYFRESITWAANPKKETCRSFKANGPG